MGSVFDCFQVRKLKAKIKVVITVLLGYGEDFLILRVRGDL